VDAGHLHAAADSDEAHLCLLADPPFAETSVGFVGASDGWQDLAAHGAMTWHFDRAEHGNVALMGRLGAPAGTVVLGLAETAEGARTAARASVADGWTSICDRFVAAWRTWASGLHLPAGLEAELVEPVRRSAAILRCHEDVAFPGAMVASLSVPWGNGRSDLGGYHLVWTRDCVESAFALLVAGQVEDCRRVLTWLVATQQPDGHWFQNSTPDGRPYWTGIQLDEVALPVVLATRLAEFGHPPVHGVPEMVRRAAGFIAANGPSSPQDRWEENPGVSPFTIAAAVAALYGAARWLEPDDAAYVVSLAASWNAQIEDWTYVTGSATDVRHGAAGHYVRLGRVENADLCGRVDIRNRVGVSTPMAALLGGDFLALVRFGLRTAGDPRIVDSVTVIDAELRAELPTGIAYYRYNGDGYGEHEDGRPFDGTGVGRPWPLLAGERGHYAAQKGDDPMPYLRSMIAMSGRGGLFPEQVWDAAPIPERLLEPGHPTGSAMPLAWAHGEFIKTAFVGRHGRAIETLDAVVEQGARPGARACWHWRPEAPFTTVPEGADVMVDLGQPFVIRRTDGRSDGRTDGVDSHSLPLGLGRHGVRLGPTDASGEFAVECEDGQMLAVRLSTRAR
jgi:glucoamylase